MQGYVKGNRKEPKDNGIQQVPVSRISSLFFRFPGFRFPGLTPVRKIGERDGAAVGTRDDRGGDEVDTLFSLVNQLHVRTSSIRRYGNRKGSWSFERMPCGTAKISRRYFLRFQTGEKALERFKIKGKHEKGHLRTWSACDDENISYS